MQEAGGKAVTDPERPAYYIEKTTDGAYLMFYEKPMPFYMAYPVPWLFDQEKEQDRDLQVMKSFYSARAARIQELAEQECDRMEYDGSMMFDDYPDHLMMRKICRRIREELSEDAGEMEAMHRNSREDSGLDDLIGVMLYNEMYRRRCRHRRCRRFF